MMVKFTCQLRTVDGFNGVSDRLLEIGNNMGHNVRKYTQRKK